MNLPTLWSRRAPDETIDRVTERYRTFASSGSQSLEEFWFDLPSTKTPSLLATLVKVDLARRFEQGEKPRAREYLERFSILTEDRGRVVSLVYEEFCLLEESGHRPDSQRFCNEYETWRDSLHSQLTYHRELSRAVGVETPSVNFPDLGDRFDKYRLNSILGVGGVARVYLATEEDLGGRQVAIKVSSSFGQEPSILARLDHRNIVPILTVAKSESGLLGICMPYRPGVTLEQLIRRIGRRTPPRKARAIVEALNSRDSPEALVVEEQVGWLDFPSDRTFPEAVAWIGLALAQALAYLHKQGVFHRDIKPANILLAYREGPQLLDFNLAKIPSNPEGATAAQRGGTLPYSAPEQLKAFLDPVAWGDVEEPADIYSLGLVLRELLTGQPPELPTTQGSLAREIQSLIDRRLGSLESIVEINPGVPQALDSIIEKCLAFRPEDRYASANDLAADLRQFLDRKPLLVAPNTSRIELGVNWIVRNRHVLLGSLAFLTGFLLLLAILPGYKPDETDFKRAEGYLDSKNPHDWEKARKEFESLCKTRPDTARSSLGLALAYLKLNDQDPNRINDLLKQVSTKSDAEQILRNRLSADPRSVVCHINLGIVLASKGQNDLARTELDEAIAIDPEGITAIVALASLDKKTGRIRESISLLAKAIQIGLAKQILPEKIYSFRQSILNQFVDLLDHSLDSRRSSFDLDDATAIHRQFSEHLTAFEGDWLKIAANREKDWHDYYDQYYQGCLDSTGGALEALANQATTCARTLDEAKDHFISAGELAERLGSLTDAQQVRSQMQKLSQRRELHGSLP